MSKPPDEATTDIQRKLAETFRRTAEVLEQSAQLADDDADRKARQHNSALEAVERGRAERARAAADRARVGADRLDP